MSAALRGDDGTTPQGKATAPGRPPLVRAGVALVAVWVLLSAAVVIYTIRSHRAFQVAITRAFDERQELSASLIQQLLVNHVREAVQDLGHLAHMYQGSTTTPPDFGMAASRILLDHAGTFQALTVIAPDDRVLYQSGGPDQPNPLANVSIDSVDAKMSESPFLSERVITPAGQPSTYLFVPFRLPAPDGPRHLLVGRMDFKQFLSSDISRIIGAEISVLLADYFGDIYFVASAEHGKFSEMERGELFPPTPACLQCHRVDSFDDIRRSVQTNGVVHMSYRSANGRLLDRTSLPFPILNEKWVVGISTPYERVQGQIKTNARTTTVAVVILLGLLGAGAVVGHRTRQRAILQRHYYSIIDTIRVGMCRLSAQGVIIGANPAFDEMLGIPHNEARGRRFTGLAVDSAAAQAFLKGVGERGAWMDHELQLARLDGSSFTASLAGVVVRDGSDPHIDVAVQDITPRKRAEEELRKAKELLEQQNDDLKKLDRMKDALLRDVAHELKTPVAKHAMQLEILRPMLQAHKIQERELRAFQVMDESIRRQQGVIRNLLNLARLEAGGRQYRKEPLRLDELLRRVQGDYQYAIDTYGVQFDLEAPEITVRSDEEMLWHVFSNLVNNAIKFRRQGEPARILVRAETTAARVVVKIEDNGIGLSPADLERVFTRFYQATASSEGSGVGLSICRNIVADLGGRIRLSSPGPGAGTVVEVELPL